VTVTTNSGAIQRVELTGGPRTYDTIASPLGTLLLVAESGVLVELGLDEQTWTDAVGATWSHDPSSLGAVRRELDEYFAGERRSFSIPFALGGTTFQRTVWEALTAIPYGETATYGEIAAAIGRPTAARAIGGANHVNPVPIVVPCHRVIGADGSLTGYGGGLDRKMALLAIERDSLTRAIAG
jgi:methylated-DNA-[protein]-cysteine S-methyltransferase